MWEIGSTFPRVTGPDARTGKFLAAQWRRLVMLNYEADPTVLRPLVPRGVERDTWGGKHFVSVVGFQFLDTRLLGVPVPFHRDFDEINLRFYVRRRADDGSRRGVVFVKEIVPRPALAAVARAVYGEKYVARPMRHRIDLAADRDTPDGVVEYSWRDAGAWHHVRATTQGGAEPLVEGSQEQFITEHYWGYAAQLDGGTIEYQVGHPPWRVWRAASSELDCNVDVHYGKGFASALSAKPVSAFLAEGSPITVRRGVRMVV